jgi:hypothetical protein
MRNGKFGVCRGLVLSVPSKKVSDLPQWKKDFMSNLSQKCIYDGLKSMLGIQILILIRSDPDAFGQIRILERATAVRGLIFQPHSLIEIRDIANLPYQRTAIFHLQMRYSTNTYRCFEMADFYMEKRFLEL